MLPEVEDFNNALESARQYWNVERYDDNIEYDTAITEYRKRLQAAREHLTKSSNSLVRWIGNNDRIMGANGGYMGEAAEILELLPAPFERLNDYAKNEARWCETWEEFVEQAKNDGVLRENYTTEYRMNASNWRSYRVAYGDLGKPLAIHDELIALCKNGIHTVTFEYGHNFFTYRTKRTIDFA